jgi:hypothetical protein
VLSLLAACLLPVLLISREAIARLPVGGDATRFGIGLMGELSRALRSSPRVPLWNSLWGYGFPALAESQLGAFYPPHLILYRICPLEWAYVLDQTIHVAWACLGVWVLSAKLGRSGGASVLAAFAFAASGFFLVHEPHHWAWPTTAWMPWIWWAFLRLASNGGRSFDVRVRDAITLGLCSAMPVLTGHFQMGFVGLVTGMGWLMSIFATNAADTNEIGKKSARIGKLLALLLLSAVVAAGLSAVQVIPTKELADIADRQRDWEYLSGFAAPPSHWVGLLVPALGRQFPFWRPLLWDQFHTSPEEVFFYVGIAPLWLAIFALIHTWRTDRHTRALAIVLGLSLVLAAGPYVPGFSLLIELPGFSYFRAPARWTAASSLALALLAARGWDEAISRTDVARKSLRRFCVVSGVIVCGTIGLIEITIRSSLARSADSSPILNAANLVRGVALPPWDDRLTAQDWVRRSAAVLPAAVPAYVKPYTDLSKARFGSDRPIAYIKEVGPHVGLLVAAFVGSFLIRGSSRRFAAIVVAVMAADLAVTSRLRSIETAPIGDLASQSPVLKRLQEFSSDSDWPVAVLGDLGNLPMAVGASPLRAYRTLDVPVMPELDAMMTNPIEAIRSPAARLAGVGMVVVDPPTWAQIKGRFMPNGAAEVVDDPTLWGWLTTKELAKRGPTTFALIQIEGPTGRAWRLKKDALNSIGIDNLTQATALDRIERVAEKAKPLLVVRQRPERLEIAEDTDGEELWLIAQWAAPHWRATLTDGAGSPFRAEILPMLGGWQGVAIPKAGSWLLTLTYEPRGFRIGAAISIVSTIVTIVVWFFLCICGHRARASDERTHF